MRYKVELIKSDEGYAVGCPELPGCWSQGRTEEEAISNIRGAIQDYRSVHRHEKHGKIIDIEVPESSAQREMLAQRPPFEVKPWAMNLPREWTSGKVEDLLDILEGPYRR